MNDNIQRVKDAFNLADVVGERVRLKRTGRGYMGLCPFHSENTPSFHVYIDTQSYYCFGCHAGGDIFTYIMNTEGLDFRGALELLADRAGIELTGSPGTNSRSIYDILNMAADFYHNVLTSPSGSVARAYISRRTLSDSDINHFTLGYSPNAWDSLSLRLKKSGVSERDILRAGLAIENKNGIYDRFRGRLMFPIRDISGRVVAFGGRLIDGEGAKYINSPEGEIYSKRKTLYMLNDAKKSIREKGYSILVEGYMDAVRLHKCGFTETVASLGTSLTQEQAELLSRFAPRCYICYDGDAAGQSAALKGMYILQAHGLDVHVITLPDGQDPDEFLTHNPPEHFTHAVNTAKPLILHHLDTLKSDLANHDTRRSALKELFDGISQLDPDEILEYRAQLSDATHMRLSDLDERIMSLRKDTPPEKIYDAPKMPSPKHDDTLEAAMSALLYHSQELRLTTDLKTIIPLFNNPDTRDIVNAMMIENVDSLNSMWLSSGEPQKVSILAHGNEICSQMMSMTDLEKFTNIRNGLIRLDIDRRIAKIMSQPSNERDMNELTMLYKRRSLYSK